MIRTALLAFLALTTGCVTEMDDSAFADQVAIGTEAQALSIGIPSPWDVTATRVAVGFRHACALLPGGGLACWGSNENGRLGIGTVGGTFRNPVRVSSASDVRNVDLGRDHGCLNFGANGIIQCWGRNDFGEIGTASGLGDRAVPTTVPGIAGAWSFGLGRDHTCARAMGSVRCWGSRANNLLGDGSTIGESSVPVEVELADPSAISTGDYFSCAIIAPGTTREVHCWGRRLRAMAASPGYYWEANKTTWQVKLPATAFTVSVGREHACAIVEGGDVYCWGQSNVHAVGEDEVAENPVRVPLGSGAAVEISAGGSHTCARRSDDGIFCWGNNVSGQLGNGTPTSWLPPVMVSLSRVTQISAGESSTCALANGLVYCWGSNSSGQLGDGTTTNRSLPVKAKWPQVIGAPLP